MENLHREKKRNSVLLFEESGREVPEFISCPSETKKTRTSARHSLRGTIPNYENSVSAIDFRSIAHGSTAVLNTKEKQGGSPHERDPPDRLALCENGGQLLRHCLNPRGLFRIRH
jgi:hypothetical protein